MGKPKEESGSVEEVGFVEVLEGHMCSHPDMIPTQWDQPRPKPCRMIISCRCGENQHCPVCSWGRGSYPCSCTRKDLLERSITENAAVWQELADS